jgi:hypothetical protein
MCAVFRKTHEYHLYNLWDGILNFVLQILWLKTTGIMQY